MESIKKYKKINLRDFRRNLTQLKDSLAQGEVYQVIDRGETLAYFIPPKYQIKLTKTQEEIDQEEFRKLVRSLKGKFHMEKIDMKYDNYKDAYHAHLNRKYGEK